MHRLFQFSGPVSFDAFFIGEMNTEATPSTTRESESLREAKMEGGDTTWQAVLTLTWFASGCSCWRICVWPIWMLQRDIKLLQVQRKSNPRHVCLKSNLILSQQAHWTIIVREPSCQVALAFLVPLMCGLKMVIEMDHSTMVPRIKMENIHIFEQLRDPGVLYSNDNAYFKWCWTRLLCKQYQN